MKIANYGIEVDLHALGRAHVDRSALVLHDFGDLVRVSQYPFGKEEARGEFPIMTGGSHGDCDVASAQSDLQWLFHRHQILRRLSKALVDLVDGNRDDAAFHVWWLRERHLHDVDESVFTRAMVAKPDAVSAETPLEVSPVRLDEPKTAAGGLTAITGAMKHALGAPGVVRGAQVLLALNQFDGVDCPGCAWPEPDDHRSIAEFCENGAKAIGEEATAKRATPEFFREWSVAALSQQSDFWLGQQGRLTHPMILREGATHYEPLDWESAFRLIGEQLNALDSPDRAAFYTSGRTSNEAAFLYQLFVRQFGNNNLPDCSNMCHESSGTALQESIGRGKSTVTLADFDLADAIFVIGQNPGTNHPRMLTMLEAAARLPHREHQPLA